MRDHPATHLFADSGPLCGVTGPYHWSLVESEVSCPSCRVIIEIRALRQRHEHRVVVPLASVKPSA